MSASQNNRNTKPLSLKPLTAEQALRKALNTPPPKDQPKKRRKAKG